MKKEIVKGSLALISLLILITAILLYSGGINALKEFIKSLGPEITGTLIGFFCWFFIWKPLVESNKKAEMEELKSELVKADDLLNSQFRSIEGKLHNVNSELLKTERRADVVTDLHEIIRKQHNKVGMLVHHIYKAKPFVGGYYKDVMRKYHSKFAVEERGFHIENEYLSLMSYMDFWDYMISAQEERKKLAGEKGTNIQDTCLIARIIHSNSVHIWTNEHDKYKEFTDELLDLQKTFVDEFGGIIVRILLGPDDQPNDDYRKAMQIMEEHCIQARYMKHTDFNKKLGYDFLYLLEEEFVYAWKSDNVGNSLNETIISDVVSPEIYKKWDYLFKELENSETPITAIPDSRQYVVRNGKIHKKVA